MGRVSLWSLAPFFKSNSKINASRIPLLGSRNLNVSCEKKLAQDFDIPRGRNREWNVAMLTSGNEVQQRRSFATDAASPDHKTQDHPITVDILTPYKTHLCESLPTKVDTSAEELMKMYHTMNIIRRTEITADMLFKSQLVRGFCHLYDGQEAVSVGMEAALTPKDSFLGAYRVHGPYIGRGGTPYDVFCELMGRSPGCALGKGGSMHLYNKANKFFGGWGIVGTSGPLGTGLALGHKIAGDHHVTVTSYGDGAANQGQIYEALNMAALWSLPVIYLCENNHFGMGTSEGRASAQPTFYDRVLYIPGIKVDGMDALAVKGAFRFAKEHALTKGPIVIEADTYRYHGHSMSDPGSTYRQRSEVQEMRHSRDPLQRIRRLILQEELMSEEDLKAFEKSARQEVEDAAQKAKDAPAPEDPALWEHVYRVDKNITHHGINRRETAVTMS